MTPDISKLNSSFFQRKTSIVAQDLLGKFLVRKVGGKLLSGMIVETEAYIGPHDLACHASRGKTERTKVMFEPAGTWYVYMIYGMYYCLNIVTEEKNYPSAVLIRALDTEKSPLERGGRQKRPGCVKFSTNGPGKLCRAFQIDKKINCTSAVGKNTKLYIEGNGVKIPKSRIVKTKRIGVDYAGHWKDKKLRFYIKGNKFVSKR